jgi:Ca-activated chloride channel family protein
VTVNVQTDRELIGATAPSTRYALVSLVAPQTTHTHSREPVNVAFVLDRSGSMGGKKIQLARQAVEHALKLLRNDDRFSLIAYDDQIDVLVSSTFATREALTNARARLATIDARGSTDLCGGWLAGCEQVAQHLKDEGIGRCLLLSDGLANQGITDHGEILNHARELRQRGVITSTFGVGADFDERLLQQMADAGAGHFYFIERAVQIPDLFASELGETLEIVARGVTLTIETPAAVQAHMLNQFEITGRPERLVVQVGDLVSGQELSVVAAFDFPPGQEGNRMAATFTVADKAGQALSESVTQAWTFASDAENAAQPRNRAVDEAVGELHAARAQAKAVELNRQGDYDAAGQLLEEVARTIQSYAGASVKLRQVVVDLHEAAHSASAAMSPLMMKAMHFTSASKLRDRNAEGKARRPPKAPE